MNVFDASALLCFLLEEPGADIVESHLRAGGACSTANWSEVAQKTVVQGLSWQATRRVLLGYDLRLVPVSVADAELAARLWSSQPYLSLADRICLATTARLDAVVWTADRAWGTDDPVRQVR